MPTSKIKSHNLKKDRYVSLNNVKDELNKALKTTSPEVITFSGMGEPTLSEDFPIAVEMVKLITDITIAILTNSTKFNDVNVMSGLKNWTQLWQN